MAELNVRCPVCNHPQTFFWSSAKDYEYFTTEEKYDYYKCFKCITIFIYPVPDVPLTLIYPKNYYSYQNFQSNWAFRIKEFLDSFMFRKLLKDIKSSSINVLDVGGGSGYLLDYIKKIDKRVQYTCVVDIDKGAKNFAEEKGHQFYASRIEDFQTENRFHLILMLNLIEHVSDPLLILKNSETLLFPGGSILIKTPNVESLDASIFQNSYWGGLHCPRHWIIFSKKSIQKVVSNTNLKLVNLVYTQGGPFWAFSIIIYLFRKGIVRVSSSKPVIYHPLFPIISSVFALFDFTRKFFSKTSQMFIVLKKE